MLENLQLQHFLYDDVIQRHLAVSFVLADFSRDIYRLLFYADIAYLDIAQLCWPNECIVLEHTGQ